MRSIRNNTLTENNQAETHENRLINELLNLYIPQRRQEIMNIRLPTRIIQSIINRFMSYAGLNELPDQSNELPASEEQIGSLPQRQINATEATNYDDCAICQQNFLSGNVVTFMPCLHVFHSH